MSGIFRRSFLVCSALLLLTACQSLQQGSSADQFAVAEKQFATHLADQQLTLAGQQLEELSSSHAEDPRFSELQQRLANAWLARGEQALHDADIEAASAALIQAKRLLPQAPALTKGLSAALSAAKKPMEEQPAVAPAPVKQPPAQKKSVEPAKQGKPDEPNLQQTDTEPDTTVAPPPRRTIKARLIDANAASSVIPMPMLDKRNNYQLGRLLDDVAVDVVRFRAAVSIEVADTRDFHWVAALLSTRVKKIDGNFKPSLTEVIRSEQPAQLIITPSNSL